MCLLYVVCGHSSRSTIAVDLSEALEAAVDEHLTEPLVSWKYQMLPSLEPPTARTSFCFNHL
jgi:hypothetical protein